MFLRELINFKLLLISSGLVDVCNECYSVTDEISVKSTSVLGVMQLQYRDRAKERRAKYGQPEPPLPKRRKADEEPAPVP